MMHVWVLRIAFLGLAAWLLFVAAAQADLRAGGIAPAPAPPPIEIEHGQRFADRSEAVRTANLLGRMGPVRLVERLGMEGVRPARAIEPPPPSDRFVVHIDGIGPGSNPRRIEAIANALAERGIPFLIVVRDRGGDLELADRPALATALLHAAKRGGALVAEPGPPIPRADAAAWSARFDRLEQSYRRAGLPRPQLLRLPPAAPLQAHEAARGRFAARIGAVRYRLPGGGEIAQSFAWASVDIRGDLVLPGRGGGDPRVLAFGPDAEPGAVVAAAEEARAQGLEPAGLRDVFAAAPAHASSVPRLSAVSLANAGWLAALPPLDAAALVALLALVVAMWLGGEIALALLPAAFSQRAARRASARPAR